MPDLASLFIFPLFLLFVRVGSCLMLFPSISDVAVNTQVRLMIAVLVSLAMFPLIEPTMPALPESNTLMLKYIFIEMAIGIMMAISAKIFMSAMHVAGELIGFSAGLHASTLFDPTSGSQSTAPAIFLGVVASLLVFVTNLHHVMIEGLFESYSYFPAGNLPPLGDASLALLNVVRDIFIVGIKLAAPVMVIGFLSYFAFGVFNRLIPQLQVFFVALPLTIVVGLFILGLSLGSMILLFSNELMEHAILFRQST